MADDWAEIGLRERPTDDVVELTIDRPARRNALTVALVGALAERASPAAPDAGQTQPSSPTAPASTRPPAASPHAPHCWASSISTGTAEHVMDLSYIEQALIAHSAR